MKKILLLVLCLPVLQAGAQTKVFKEVSEDVESVMKPIIQDNSLVGYILFSRLEKASEDSFNYRISLMDENLNDIGVVNFRDINLNLIAASFEQDILCLSYLKSRLSSFDIITEKQYNLTNSKSSVMTQFLTLNGKIIKTNEWNVSLKMKSGYYNDGKKTLLIYQGQLLQTPVLRNIPGKGFVCFFGDEKSRYLISYDLQGNQRWANTEMADGQSFDLRITSAEIYYLIYGAKVYYLSGISVTDGKEEFNTALRDTHQNPLHVLNWDPDPVSGKIYLSGNITNKYEHDIETGKNLLNSPFIGLFSAEVNGNTAKSIKYTFKYWDDGSVSDVINKKGRINEPKAYAYLSNSFRDYSGNTYYIGTSFIVRPKIGTFLFDALFAALAIADNAPGGLVLPAIITPASGVRKLKSKDALILKLNSKSTLSFENTFPLTESSFRRGAFLISPIIQNRSFHVINDDASKSSFVIAEDPKTISIYSVKKQSVIRTIPQQEGHTKTQVLPAKEGHMMIVEYNKKEKYTRLSIEPLN